MEPEATDIILVADVDGCYVDANEAALELLDIGRDELRRHRVGDFAPDGFGPIHLALYLWVVRQGHDFGGGTSTMVRPDGTPVRVVCRAIEPDGDAFRIAMHQEAGESTPPQSEAVAAILEAWREAEREIDAACRTDPEYELARSAAGSLRDIYHFVVREKTAVLAKVKEL